MSEKLSHRPLELSLVIPVYNSSKTIAKLVEGLVTLDISGGFEIVLVNDGSEDNSAEICRDIVAKSDAKIVFLDLTRNFGKHNAVLTGLRHTSGRYVVTMDDDFQNAPAEVPKLYQYTKTNDLDVVYTRFAKKQHSTFRNLGSKFANFTADLVLNKPKGLYLSSFRCLTRIVVDHITKYAGPYPYIDGLIFQTTTRVGSIEVEHLPRAENSSNYTLSRLVKLWINILLNFSTLPLRLSLWLGITMAFVSAIGIIYVFIDFFTYGNVAPGWASLMIVVLAFSGLQFIFVGILGEYLGRLFISFGNRPQSIIRNIYSGGPDTSSDNSTDSVLGPTTGTE